MHAHTVHLPLGALLIWRTVCGPGALTLPLPHLPHLPHRFDAPRFLDTCSGNARKVVSNHGVELVDGSDALIKRVLALANQYYRDVPVLVITSSSDELTRMHKALCDGGDMPSDEVQRLSEFDANGVSLKTEWQTVIDDATKRIGTTVDNRCRVTVTDRFGGRGHDFQVMDKEANANGGMLVIATSIPDEREWIQWKGRTARQDRPGQFYVILDQRAAPFSEAQHKALAGKVENRPHTWCSPTPRTFHQVHC